MSEEVGAVCSLIAPIHNSSGEVISNVSCLAPIYHDFFAKKSLVHRNRAINDYFHRPQFFFLNSYLSLLFLDGLDVLACPSPQTRTHSS